MRGLVSLALIAFAFAVAAGADPLPARAPRVADYQIRVTLDPEAKTLSGDERITWRNPGDEPVGELWFHLYLNAFKNTESTFFKESGGQLRGDLMPDEGWGFIDVTKVRRKDGADLAGGARFEQPDDGNAADRTVWRVPLPEPVPAGGTAVLTLPSNPAERVGYLNLRTFISTADAPLRNAFLQFRNQGIRYFILDLRYNGGGLVGIADLIGNLLGGGRLATDVFENMVFNTGKSANNSTHFFMEQPQSVSPLGIAFITTGSTASASAA